MPRFFIERDFGQVEDDELQTLAAASKRIAAERFPEIVWEHSHVVQDESGAVKSFCVYSAPDEAMVREHADAFGGHSIVSLYEVIGDITPAEIPG